MFRIGIPSVGEEEPTGTSATVNAVIALNRIAALLDASIEDSSTIGMDGTVTVSAINSSEIEATVLAPAVTIALELGAQEPTTAVSIALVITRNDVDADVTATIDHVQDLDSTGVSVQAEQSGSIDAKGTAVALTLTAGFQAANGVSGGGVVSFNKVTGSVAALIQDSDVDATTTATDGVTVEALNDASINAQVIAAVVTVAASPEATNVGAIGFALAFNYVGYNGDIRNIVNPAHDANSLTTTAKIRNSHVTGKKVSVNAETTATVDAITAAELPTELISTDDDESTKP